jgi:ligand-binding SRPBCC domain-containing protein
VAVLERTQVLPVPLNDAFAFFADPQNLGAITPQWLDFEIVDAPAQLEEGSLISYRLRLFRVPIRWQTRIVEWRPPHGFVDVQLAGPYRQWEHSHRLRDVAGGTEIADRVSYRLPFEPAASLVARFTVERWLDAIFDYRADRVAALLRQR